MVSAAAIYRLHHINPIATATMAAARAHIVGSLR
jgi:hypothetical protein